MWTKTWGDVQPARMLSWTAGGIRDCQTRSNVRANSGRGGWRKCQRPGRCQKLCMRSRLRLSKLDDRLLDETTRAWRVNARAGTIQTARQSAHCPPGKGKMSDAERLDTGKSSVVHGGS